MKPLPEYFLNASHLTKDNLEAHFSTCIVVRHIDMYVIIPLLVDNRSSKLDYATSLLLLCTGQCAKNQLQE